MKKRILILFILLWGSARLMAQESMPMTISVEARGDFQHTLLDKEVIGAESGFKGNILNLIMKGELTSTFSYAYRQRFNAINRDAAFFDSVDWLFLNYHPVQNLKLTLGKMPVFVGGWELDLAPIDCFFLSSFCYHFPCYEWGVSIDYATTSGNDNITLQLCQSPFQVGYSRVAGATTNMYAYNLIWHGHHGFFAPIWSVNMMEYAPNKYINYISLGNRFYLSDRVQMDLEFMNRAAVGHTFIGEDYTFVGQVSYQPIDKLNLYAKGTYDVNRTDSDADLCVLKGTEITRLGGGFEYFPLSDKSVRIHGHYSYSFGTNTQPGAYVRDKFSMFDIGVTWRVKVM